MASAGACPVYHIVAPDFNAGRRSARSKLDSERRKGEIPPHEPSVHLAPSVPEHPAASHVLAVRRLPPPASAGSRAVRGADAPALRVAQWRTSLPGYDDWFDRKFAREWGERNGVTVEIDHLALSELRARADPRSRCSGGTTSSLSRSRRLAYEAHVTPVTDS